MCPTSEKKSKNYQVTPASGKKSEKLQDGSTLDDSRLTSKRFEWGKSKKSNSGSLNPNLRSKRTESGPAHFLEGRFLEGPFLEMTFSRNDVFSKRRFLERMFSRTDVFLNFKRPSIFLATAQRRSRRAQRKASSIHKSSWL